MVTIIFVKTTQLASWSANLLGIACEALIVAQQALYLLARSRAERLGALSAFEAGRTPCSVVLIGSDLPRDQLWTSAPIFWHLLMMILLLLMLISDLPGGYFIKRLSSFVFAFGALVGTWQEGACQIYIGLAMLSVPVNIWGTGQLRMWRWCTAWLLVAVGLANIIMGLSVKYIRVFRSQNPAFINWYKAKVNGDNKGDKCLQAFFLIDSATQARDVHGLMAAKAALRSAIKMV